MIAYELGLGRGARSATRSQMPIFRVRVQYLGLELGFRVRVIAYKLGLGRGARSATRSKMLIIRVRV